ncbi:MAG TPA: hypothetical protein VF698_16880 [Thermoanaerobaculia bacterium]
MIHIHNGDVVAVLAQRAGLPGAHLAFRESLVSGPVTPGPDWLATRAHHLAAMSGQDVLRVSNELFEQEQALDAAMQRDDVEIVLWFEHDLFCLVNLLYLLQRFGDRPLSLVWNATPLGESDERSLTLCHESRRAVTPSQLALARQAWRDYTSSDPTALNHWLDHDSPDFPFLREAMTLHATRFPSARNGLGAIEQRALALIGAGVTDFVSIFPRLDGDPPRFGFGDTQVLAELRGLGTRAVPLVTITEADDSAPPPKAIFTITPAGENVLRGAVDDAKINDRDFWLGGAHITRETLWRFDDQRKQIVPSRSAGS